MRILAVLTLLPLLAGCSDADWNRMLSFGGSDPATTTRPVSVATATPPAPAPVEASPAPAATPNPFCLGIARQNAMTNDFDTATQQKVAVRAYQQCQEIFGN